ncbi:MAG: 2,3-dimethylmalate lyase, partial [Rhabdaerophilum sp.]
MGFSVAFYAVTALFAAARAMQEALGILKADGRPQALADKIMTYAEFSTLVELPRYQELDNQFG